MLAEIFYLQKKQVSTEIELPGFVVSIIGLQQLGIKLNHRGMGINPTKINRRMIIRKKKQKLAKRPGRIRSAILGNLKLNLTLPSSNKAEKT